MDLNTPYRLPEAVSPAVPVILLAESVLVENHAGTFIRITDAVQIPLVTGVSALNRHSPHCSRKKERHLLFFSFLHCISNTKQYE